MPKHPGKKHVTSHLSGVADLFKKDTSKPSKGKGSKKRSKKK